MQRCISYHPPYPTPSKFLFTRFSSSARLAKRSRISFAPTGHDTIAQGIALGIRFPHDPSPERAEQPLCRPFRAKYPTRPNPGRCPGLSNVAPLGLGCPGLSYDDRLGLKRSRRAAKNALGSLIDDSFMGLANGFGVYRSMVGCQPFSWRENGPTRWPVPAIRRRSSRWFRA